MFNNYKMNIISNKYKIIDKLTNGTFGTIYKGENIRTGEFVAIKFEPKNCIMKSLKNEAKIYQYLGKQDGFPQLKWFGSNDTNTYLVIDLLGVSLSEMLKKYKAFSLKSVLLLGIQIIKRVQTLHNFHLLHRDIKPDNFLFGLGLDTNKLYLVDFGLSKRYNYDGIHIPEKHINSLVGSPNFVSLNVHKKVEPSRRDDLESCIYIIINMLLGKLEWVDKMDHNEISLLKYQLTSLINVPFFIKNMLDYIRNIRFDETPDYDYLINIMITILNENGFTNDNILEWN